MTIGAPQRCVTLCIGDQVVHRLGAHLPQADVRPALTLIDQGKHQPLQWNIGSVQR